MPAGRNKPSEASKRKTMVKMVGRRTRSGDAAVGMENVNSNSSVVATPSPKKRKLTTTSPRKKAKSRNKVIQVLTNSEKDAESTEARPNKDMNQSDIGESSQSLNITEVARFEEDGNEIEVEVMAPANEFLSDGEVDLESEVENEPGESDAGSGDSDQEQHNDHSSRSSGSDSEEEEHKRRLERKRQHKLRRESLENKLDTMGETLKQMQLFMIQKGMFTDDDNVQMNTPARGRSGESKMQNSGSKKGKKNCELSLNNSNSETTIYKSAVEFRDESDDEVILNLKGKRVSSSSEEPIDTSDEMLEVENNVNKTITEIRHSVGGDLVCDERLLPNPGNKNSRIINWQVNQGASSSMDDNYLVIGSHVDSSLQAKIMNHEYVDFARLLPKDRISKEDDN